MNADTQLKDEDALKELNVKIGAAESSGDREWLASILAPHLAFQRADKLLTVDDENAFLWKVKAGGRRATEIVEPIQLFGNRAIVQCIVRVWDSADKELGKFHNLRLFVKRAGQWKLLGWANEEQPAG